MLIENEIEITKIRKKINDFFDLDLYSDFLFLTPDNFDSKYGYFGFAFHNYWSIRFKIESGIFQEICAFLPNNEYYVISLSKKSINFYTFTKSQIPKFLEKNKINDFVIFEKE